MKASQQSASIKEGKKKERKKKKSLGKVLPIMKPDLLKKKKKNATRGCCVGSGD